MRLSIRCAAFRSRREVNTALTLTCQGPGTPQAMVGIRVRQTAGPDGRDAPIKHKGGESVLSEPVWTAATSMVGLSVIAPWQSGG
jgi:hypothetical protein